MHILQLLLIWLINYILLYKAQDVGCVFVMGIVHIYKAIVLQQNLI